MKKFLAIVLALTMVLALCACGGSEAPAAAPEAPAADAPAAAPEAPAKGANTLYVMGPTPDHGWTAQAGAYAQAKCEEITAAGQYKAVYLPASSGEEQVDQINTIIANGDAVEVVMMALDDSAQAGQEALYAEGIPFISFDRIIEATEKYAILNASGDNWQCGAGIAYWLQKNGMQPGDTVVVLYGDNGTVCSRRQEGFEQFLRGEVEYSDKQTGSYKTTQVWEQADLDAIFNGYTVVCNWSADGAYDYIEQKFEEIVAAAKANNGKLYIYSMDDEMTFGVLNYLEAGASDALKADVEALDLYISAIGGMQELYDVMAGTDAQSALADQYFDDMMSMYFSPKMMQDIIETGLKYLAGDWAYEQGSGEYQPTWIVDAGNVANFEGFKGHA